MRTRDVIALLRKHGYRDTQPRRLVVEALHGIKDPASPYDLQKWIAEREGNVSIVTVYRIIELFQRLGLVHKHSCSGKLSLCEHLGQEGLHGYLHCHECGDSQEFCSSELSSVTTKQAATHGFKASSPMLEIIGSCKSCIH